MENKHSTEALLGEIYRNVAMGSENLGNLIPMVKNRFLMQHITAQMESYADFTNQAAHLLKQQAVLPRKISVMGKLISRSGVMLNTLFDASESNLVRIIARGTDLGADSLERVLHRGDSQEASAQAISLAQAVVAFERTEAEKMRGFV